MSISKSYSRSFKDQPGRFGNHWFGSRILDELRGGHDCPFNYLSQLCSDRAEPLEASGST